MAVASSGGRLQAALTTFPTGAVMDQARPSARNSSATSAPRKPVTMVSITRRPKPEREGAPTAGPSSSVQVSVSRSSDSRHSIRTEPDEPDQAPYLDAFVPSSCSARPIVCTAPLRICTSGPSILTRSLSAGT